MRVVRPVPFPAQPVKARRSRLSSGVAAIDDLGELVAALDRRVPHLERDGEHAIAHDAQALRAEALRRIAELECAAAPAAAVGGRSRP